MIAPAAIILILLVCALLLRSAANRARSRAALPDGKVLYSDTIKQERPSETLISWRHGLKGCPDYLIETKEGIVPVEIKSAAFPRSGHPYEAHVMKHLMWAFPRLVSYNRFVELMPSALVPLCGYFQSRKGACSDISFIDSTSLKVCHNRRIHSHQVFQGCARRGKTSVDWFYGFKLHLVINDCG